MTFTQSITICMSKYATFKGRASRSEFWWFYLFAVLLGWAASVVGAVTMPAGSGLGDIFSLVVNLVLLLPSLAAGARRLHDIGRSGWWLLLCLTGIGIILLIIWWVQDTKHEANNYGPASVPAQ